MYSTRRNVGSIWSEAGMIYPAYVVSDCISRPEKLPLKIHTGYSRTFYSYWVGKALHFQNWSSFSRHMPSPYVSNSCGFSIYYVDRKQWAAYQRANGYTPRARVYFKTGLTFFWNARLFTEAFWLKLRTEDLLFPFAVKMRHLISASVIVNPFIGTMLDGSGFFFGLSFVSQSSSNPESLFQPLIHMVTRFCIPYTYVPIEQLARP